MDKITFKLMQHTPIIHTVYGHPKETLRATELKSKLNHYLKEIGIQSPRYQVHIDLTYNPLRGEPLSKLYLGNMRRNKDEKILYRLANENITIAFNTYFNEELKENIKKVLPKTLCLENFGSRSNKGFGCFTLKNTTVDEFEDMLKKYVKGVILFWEDNQDLQKVYRHISNIYQAIKSGFGKGISKSSILSGYFSDEKKTLWERSMIYKVFFNKEDNNYQEKDKKYVRALLGIPKDITWGRDIITISSLEFERIKSPIIFKVFEIGQKQYRIYFWYNIYEKYFDIKGKPFLFQKGNQKFKINTPKFGYDDINKLMKIISNEYCRISLKILNKVKNVR